MKRSKQERIEIINAIIREIASRGRKFLCNEKTGAVGHFKHDGRTLWYVDYYTGVAMAMRKGQNIKNNKQRMNFCGGGTMWGLVCDFTDFIYGDDNSNHNHGYGGLHCPHWGYPVEDMEAIRAKAVEMGYLQPCKVS